MVFQFRQQTYALKFKRGFVIFCVAVIGLFLYLGEWQVYRYHFKQKLVQDFQQNQHAAPLTQLNNITLEKQFSQVAISGAYENAFTLLIPNKPYDNQIGFEVFTPIKTDGKLLLIDRGWMKQAGTKAPEIPAAATNKPVQGTIKFVNEYQYVMGKNILSAQAPLQMQKIDFKALEKMTGQSFYPFIVRLDPTAENGFVRQWIISAMQPERHLGYAVQWFAMALVLSIMCFCYCCEAVTRK
jgi:surfeit locus 1 family protein